MRHAERAVPRVGAREAFEASPRGRGAAGRRRARVAVAARGTPSPAVQQQLLHRQWHVELGSGQIQGVRGSGEGGLPCYRCPAAVVGDDEDDGAVAEMTPPPRTSVCDDTDHLLSVNPFH